MFRPPRSSWFRQYVARELLGSEIDRSDDEQPRYPREDRGVDDAEAVNSTDSPASVEDRSDRGGSARMMSPGIGAHPVPQCLAIGAAGRDLLFGDFARFEQRAHHRAHHCDAFNESVEVLFTMFPEVAKLDLRRIARIPRREPYCPATITSPAFQNGPAERVEAGPARVGIAREVTREAAHQSHEHEVGVAPACAGRSTQRRERCPVRYVHAPPPAPPAPVERIVAREARALERLPGARHAVHNRDLVAVLEVASDLRQFKLGLEPD